MPNFIIDDRPLRVENIEYTPEQTSRCFEDPGWPEDVEYDVIDPETGGPAEGLTDEQARRLYNWALDIGRELFHRAANDREIENYLEEHYERYGRFDL